MPKMRGFLRSKPKIDEADWTIAQIRTAARLEDLFAADGVTSAKDGTSSPAADADEAPPSIVVGPGTWPNSGPRPPIIVVGGTPVGAVPAEGTRTQTTHAPGDADRAPVDDDPGVAADAASEPTGAEPIGVMANPGDVVGDDTWDLPGARVRDVQLTLPTAVHVSPARPAPRLGKPAKPPSGRHRDATRSAPTRAIKTKSRSAPAPAAYCPYCAKLQEPAPTRSRRCDSCRQRIIVKRVNKAAVYLTEAAVLVFESERRRISNATRWTRERDGWLRLASAAGAPSRRAAQLADARISESVVAAARTLYLSTVDRTFRTARRDHDWDEASRVRRAKAAVMYQVAGSAKPPPADVIAIFREGVAAELRGVAEMSRDAELVSARCCDICRADDRLVVRIAQELRASRLPHAGCPRGLCRCRWDLAARDRMTMRRYLRRRPGAKSRVAPDQPVPIV